MRYRIRDRAVWVLLALLVCGVGAALAQSDGSHRPGLLRGIRERLIPPDPQRAWDEAAGLPAAAEAVPLMEHLAGRGGEEGGRAALWLGHFAYGAGDEVSALPWFERASEALEDPARHAEAEFWVRHCRSLLGRSVGPASTRRGPTDDPHAVLARMAALDADLRLGRAAEARRGYLELHDAARDAGCLGPLLYRLGLVLAAGPGEAAGLDWETLSEWSAVPSASPERALLRAMQPAPREVAPVRREDSPAGERDGRRFSEPGPADTAAAPAVAADSAAAALGAGPADGGSGAGPDGGATDAPASSEGAFTVQLGSFLDPERARLEARRLEGLGLNVRLDRFQSDDGERHRIRLGNFRSREEAEELARTRCTGLDWRVVRLEP